MLSTCGKAVYKLGMALWLTGILYSTGAQVLVKCSVTGCLYTKLATRFAQFLWAFTQGVGAIFNLLAKMLFPLSTPPINNTNLIKGFNL